MWTLTLRYQQHKKAFSWLRLGVGRMSQSLLFCKKLNRNLLNTRSTDKVEVNRRELTFTRMLTIKYKLMDNSSIHNLLIWLGKLMKITYFPNIANTSKNLNLNAIASMSLLRENGTFLINGDAEQHWLNCVNYAFSLINGNMFKNNFDVIYQTITTAS